MNIFEKVKNPIIKQATVFDLSHQVKLSTDFGKLTPIMCEPTFPGDYWKYNAEVYSRFAPMLAPIMHMVNVYVHSFRVDIFNLWENAKVFFSGGRTGLEEPEYPRLQINYSIVKDSYDQKLNLFGPGSIWDYLGFPILEDKNGVLVKNGYHDQVDALPFLAYYKIWQIYYADENVTEFAYEEDYKLEDGVKSPTWSKEFLINTSIKFRCYEKDYFTSALPWPQRGGDVRIPMQDLQFDASIGFSSNAQPDTIINASPTNPSALAGSLKVDGNSQFLTDSSSHFVSVDNSKNLVINGNTGQVNAATINELRRAFAAQAWKETSARTGWRLPEFILGHYGVKNSDYRYFYPHYLGGGKAPVVIGEVLQQSQTTTDADSQTPSPLGAMAGRATASANTNRFSHRFNDYGYIISIMSFLPRSEYQGGMPRKYRKFTRWDYAFPEFAHLGEQEVKNEELYYTRGDQNSENINQATFGYQSRYAEYKYIPSTTHGDFINDLSFWHLGRSFKQVPGLNTDFLECRPEDCSRIFAVEREVEDRPLDHIWVQVYNNVTAKRLLPKYGTPSRLV